METYVSVHLDPQVARDISSPVPNLNTTVELRAAADNMGFRLEPLHPGTKDPVLATHFFVRAPDVATANAVRERLASFRAVQAAYVKPKDAPPALPTGNE
jgi:hypothetical protein